MASRNGLDRDTEGMEKTQTHKYVGKIELGCLHSQMEKAHCPRISHDYYTELTQRQRHCSQLNRRIGYSIHINKEARFMASSWFKEAGVANLGRTVSVGEQCSGCKICGEKSTVDIYFLSTLFIHGPEGKDLPSLSLPRVSPQQGKGNLLLSKGSESRVPVMAVIMSTTHVHSGP